MYVFPSLSSCPPKKAFCADDYTPCTERWFEGKKYVMFSPVWPLSGSAAKHRDDIYFTVRATFGTNFIVTHPLRRPKESQVKQYCIVETCILTILFPALSGIRCFPCWPSSSRSASWQPARRGTLAWPEGTCVHQSHSTKT